ncbi:MAG: methylisocitrate lyase [Thermodesulfobacteriota bacterium]|nr:MAG: methylisocitrate lyase [Thermodesulfobacteriota bacterium]
MAEKSLKTLMREGIVVMPGVFNGITARLAEEAGFKALYISGAGLANGVAAMPDMGLLTMTEVLTLAGYITGAVKVPCVVDGDTGFGEALNVMRMVEGLERIGAAGVHIEDQEMPKKCGHLSGKRLVTPEDMAGKIAAAVEARKDPEFLIIARTDARAVEGLDGAIKRAQLYIEAGADCVFPEALESKEEFTVFRNEVNAPLLANMTEFGKTPLITVKEFEEMGYNLVIFPLTAFRVMLRSVKGAFERLKVEGTQEGFLGEMFTRDELYELIGYEGYEEVDRKVAGLFSPGKKR